MNFFTLSIDKTITELDTNVTTGLNDKEVSERQKKYGYNLLASKRGKSVLARFLAQFSDFMIIVLIIAAIVSFAVSVLKGHADYVDPIIIFAIITLNAILGVIQEEKAEKSLEALKKMSAPNAIVLRNGKQCTIPSKELVPGDVIYLETGHYVPADCRLIESVNLKVDILSTKSLGFRFYTSGNLAADYSLSGDITCDIDEITVAGKSNVLSGILVTPSGTV